MFRTLFFNRLEFLPLRLGQYRFHFQFPFLHQPVTLFVGVSHFGGVLLDDPVVIRLAIGRNQSGNGIIAFTAQRPATVITATIAFPYRRPDGLHLFGLLRCQPQIGIHRAWPRQRHAHDHPGTHREHKTDHKKYAGSIHIRISPFERSTPETLSRTTRRPSNPKGWNQMLPAIALQSAKAVARPRY